MSWGVLMLRTEVMISRYAEKALLKMVIDGALSLGGRSRTSDYTKKLVCHEILFRDSDVNVDLIFNI